MQSVQKAKEKKTEGIILKFCSLISQDWLAQFVSNLVCRFA